MPQAGLGHPLMEHPPQKRTKSGAEAPWAVPTWHPWEACSQSPCSTVFSRPWWGFSLPRKPRRRRAEGEDSSHFFPAFIQKENNLKKKKNHIFFLHLWVIKCISTTCVSPLPRLTQVSPSCEGAWPALVRSRACIERYQRTLWWHRRTSRHPGAPGGA